jgi:hypothetical protein
VTWVGLGGLEPPTSSLSGCLRYAQELRMGSLDRPGDLGGSDPWRGWEPCQHSGGTPRSCASAR